MKLGHNLYKVQDNLHVRGNSIISYHTVVALIEDDMITKLGKFSRTSARHINKISEMLGIPIQEVKVDNPIFYDKYNYGVKIDFDGSISPKTTSMIFEEIKSGSSYPVALAYLYDGIRKKDLDLLDKSGINGVSREGFLILRRFSHSF